MASRKPEDILQLVSDHKQVTSALRERMESDYRLLRLAETIEPFPRSMGADAGDTYAKYTSNAPTTYLDKITSWTNSATPIIRIPHIDQSMDLQSLELPQDTPQDAQKDTPREGREADDQKERFFYGILRAGDERLAQLILPPLLPNLSWYAAARGWITARSLLAKRDDGSTYVDIMPWDPLHTYWGMNADGLAWACYVKSRLAHEVELEYDVSLSDMAVNRTETGTRFIDVYYFYDDEDYTIIAEGATLKKAEPHGSPCIPCVVVPVAYAPPIASDEDKNSIADYGESIFKANRNIYPKKNLIDGIMLELAERALKPPLFIPSEDGTKTLPADPYQTGQNVSGRKDEKPSPLDMLEMARETGVLLIDMDGEIQRGSVPHTSFGDLQVNISGYAINQLTQNVQGKLQPLLDAIQVAYQQILRLISEQYITGSFETMEVSGRDQNRRYFSEKITPDAIKKGGDPEVRMFVRLPQDDAAKMAMAQMAREGDVPLFPDAYVREDILAVQDVDRVDDAIKEQIGERSLPEAGLWALFEGLMRRGRWDLAMFYFGRFQEIMLEKQMALQQGLPPGAAPPQQPPGAAPPQQPNGAVPTNGAVPGGAGPTLNPQVAPNATLGVPPPFPTPQDGANVPPGTPRPGGQSEDQRLSSLNLVRGI